MLHFFLLHAENVVVKFNDGLLFVNLSEMEVRNGLAAATDLDLKVKKLYASWTKRVKELELLEAKLAASKIDVDSAQSNLERNLAEISLVRLFSDF